MEKQGATDVSVNFTTGEAAFVFENDIQKIVELYFTSTYHADIPGMKQAFHPNAHL